MRNRDFKFRVSEGFTLIELLVVIVIIGVLSSFLVANYVGVRMRARDTQRKSDLAQIQSALELYRSDVGAYPAALPACGSSFSSGGITYMRKVPCDPTNSTPLVYRYRSAYSNSAYTLAGCLENVNDRQKDSGATPNIRAVDGGATITSCAGGSSNWSYTLFSP